MGTSAGRAEPMMLASGGIDVFYIDESGDTELFVLSTVSIPLLRPVENGQWRFAWDDYLDRYKGFRRELREVHGVPVRKELHASKLVSGRGAYRRDGQRFGPHAAAGVFRWILRHLDFLPDASVITVTATKGSNLYGATRLEACLHALFQRMQRACRENRTNGMTFFDQGHGENLAIYRKARKHLPTGSALGGWQSGGTRNMPMEHFFKDGNFKDSKHSLFIQAADLISYAAMLREKAKLGSLTAWQVQEGLGDAYDQILSRVLNLKASGRDPKGVVRL